MKHPQSTISNRQLIFGLTLVITAYSTIDMPFSMAREVGRLSWLPIIIVSILFAFAVYIVATLQNMHTGKVFFDYSKELVGNTFSKLICVFYVLVFLNALIYLNLKLINLLNSNFLPKTPSIIMLFMTIALVTYCTYKGIRNIARMFEIVGIVFITTTLVVTLFMLFQGMIEPVLPLFDPTQTQNIFSGVWTMIVPFAGLEVLFVIPFTSQNKAAPKKLFFTMLGIGALYILIFFGTVMILGLSNTSHFTDPFVEAIKIIRIPVIERTDMFYLTFGLFALFAGLIALQSAMLEMSIKFFPKQTRHKMTLFVGLAVFVACIIAMGVSEFSDLFEQITPFVIVFANMLIPLLLLAIKKLKKKSSQKERAA